MKLKAASKAFVAALFGLGFAATVQAGTLDDVKKKGELVVGLEAQFTPYEFFKDGVIVGYDVDLAEKFAKKLGVKVKLVDTDFNGIIPSLLAKKFDVLMTGLTITKERAEKLSFSMPYAEATNVILVRANEDKIKAADDLAGKRVGAQLGSAMDKLAKEFGAKLKAKGKPDYADYKLYDHFPEAYQDLLNGRIDAVINSYSTLIVVMKDQPGKFKIVNGIQDIKAYFGVAFRKEDADFTKFVNDEFAAMKASGELAELQKKWFGQTMETPNAVPDVLP